MQKTAKVLREEKAEIRHKLNQIIESVTREDRGMTDEEFRQAEELEAKETDLESRAKTLEFQERLKPEAKPEQRNFNKYTSVENRITKDDVNNALRSLAFGELPVNTPEFRSAQAKLGWHGDKVNIELRTNQQSVGDNSEGGYGVNDTLMNGVVEARKYFGGARQYADIISSPSGSTLKLLTNNDTGNSAAVVSELGNFDTVKFAFGTASLGSYMYRTSVFPVSFEVLQDVQGIDLGSYISKGLGTRIARGTNTDYTVGNGSGKCTGFMQDATLGVTCTNHTYLLADELFDLYHSVDIEYRNSPNCCWQMHDSTWAAIRKMQATTKEYILGVGINGGQELSLLGKPVVINNAMTAITAGAGSKIIAFGDFSNFKVREVGNVQLQVARELYLGQGAIGFFAWFRTDSKLVDAGTHPIKYMALNVSGSGS